jgi:hypothetical protein
MKLTIKKRVIGEKIGKTGKDKKMNYFLKMIIYKLGKVINIKITTFGSDFYVNYFNNY